jgi:hypothetical protein
VAVEEVRLASVAAAVVRLKAMAAALLLVLLVLVLLVSSARLPTTALARAVCRVAMEVVASSERGWLPREAIEAASTEDASAVEDREALPLLLLLPLPLPLLMLARRAVARLATEAGVEAA